MFQTISEDIDDLSTENDALKNKIGSYDERCLEESKAKLLKQIDDDERPNLFMSRMQKQMKNAKKLVFVSYIKLCESEFDNFAFEQDKVQDMNFNQSKLDIHETYKKDEKLTTIFEPSIFTDVINKTYLDEKLLKKTLTYL